MPMPGQAVTVEELEDLCRSRIANYKIPKRFFIRELLPMLGSGKVDKQVLKKEIAGQ